MFTIIFCAFNIVLYENIDQIIPNKLHRPMHYKIGVTCTYSVVITWHSNPPFSHSTVCVMNTRVSGQCLYTIPSECFDTVLYSWCYLTPFLLYFRLYGFKIHPLAYQLQFQAAANFKVPMRGIGHNNSKRWTLAKIS